MPTMVKAEVDDRTDEWINEFRDKTDMNKTEAVSYILEVSARASAYSMTEDYDEVLDE